MLLALELTRSLVRNPVLLTQCFHALFEKPCTLNQLVFKLLWTLALLRSHYCIFIWSVVSFLSQEIFGHLKRWRLLWLCYFKVSKIWSLCSAFENTLHFMMQSQIYELTAADFKDSTAVGWSPHLGQWRYTSWIAWWKNWACDLTALQQKQIVDILCMWCWSVQTHLCHLLWDLLWWPEQLWHPSPDLTFLPWNLSKKALDWREIKETRMCWSKTWQPCQRVNPRYNEQVHYESAYWTLPFLTNLQKKLLNCLWRGFLPKQIH